MNILRRMPLCDITTFSDQLTPTKQDCQSNFSSNSQSTSDSSEEDEPQVEREKHHRIVKRKGKKYLDSDDDDDDSDYEPQERRKNCHRIPKVEVKKEKPYKNSQISNLTEYEKMVQKNREEKLAFLESLKIDEIKESFSEAVKGLKPKSKKRPSETIKRFPTPVRKSLRLAPGKKKEKSTSEKAVVARATADLPKYEEIESQKLPPILPFADALIDESYENFRNDFSDFKHKNPKPFNRYAYHFTNMHIPESHIAQVVNSRITALAIHPMQEKIIIIAGSKYGKIGFWNVNSDHRQYIFEPHLEGVTNLRFCPDNHNLIVSSSYDGTLRCGDLVKNVFNEVYNVSDETSCTYFDFLSPNTFLVGQKNGNVSVVDYRIRIKTSEKKHKCHDYAVKTVSIHPLEKSYFILAENKGKVSLWDLRKLQKQPVVEVQHHKRCVQSAFFSPLTGKSVLTTSADDTICLLDSSNLGESLTFKHLLKHKNRGGWERLFTPFQSTWLPNADDTFVVGSVLRPRRIEVYNDKMDNIFTFRDENLNDVTSINIFHPSLPILAGANSNGKVRVFTDEST